MSHLTVLTTGHAGARFVAGVVDVQEEEDVHVVANVGNDCESWGLKCCPDIDLILHTLSGEVDPYNGDHSGSTFQCLEVMRKLGMPHSPLISDRQLATHLLRTSILKSGADLEAATADLAERFGLGVKLMPSTNDPLHTMLHTAADGPLRPLEYAARSGEVSRVEHVTFEGASNAKTSQRVLDSILGAERIIVAPGDPESGIGAFLALRDLWNALARTRASVVAISPIIGSQTAWGETDTAGYPEEPYSLVRFAEGLKGAVDSLVIHTSDLESLDAVRATGIDAWVDNILIDSTEAASRLAGRVAFEGRLVARKR